MNLIKKTVGALNKLLGIPYYIIKYVVKTTLKVFKEIPKVLKKIKIKSIVNWFLDVFKESIAQIFTLLGFFIAWFTLTGSAQDIVGIAIIVSTIIWLITIRLRS